MKGRLPGRPFALPGSRLPLRPGAGAPLSTAATLGGFKAIDSAACGGHGLAPMTRDDDASPAATGLSALRAQYEAYPYPARDPREEARRLIAGSPSPWPEVRHHLFAGGLPGGVAQGRPVKALVAGGGTGDGLILLAQTLKDAGTAAEITYLDLSTAARAIAEARARARGLDGPIRFETGSLLDIAAIDPGPYDYIDCCGVLHHLADPDAGLRALAAVLAPGGGLGIMVYAPFGREGVYPLQAALRGLTEGLAPAERVRIAKRVIGRLPPTNGFVRNPFVGDHKQSDAGLYDLLLHSQDRPYSVDQLHDWVEGAGLAVASLVPALAYDPDPLLPDPVARRRIAGWPARARAALAERLAGNLKTHVAYLTAPDRAGDCRADIADRSLIPTPWEIDPPAVAGKLRPGGALPITYHGIKHRLTLPALAPAVLKRIDGHARLADIAAGLTGGRDDADRADQVDRTVAALIGAGRMFLLRNDRSSAADG